MQALNGIRLGTGTSYKGPSNDTSTATARTSATSAGRAPPLSVKSEAIQTFLTDEWVRMTSPYSAKTTLRQRYDSQEQTDQLSPKEKNLLRGLLAAEMARITRRRNSRRRPAPASSGGASATPSNPARHSRDGGLSAKAYEAMSEAQQRSVSAAWKSSMYSPRRKPDDHELASLSGSAETMRDCIQSSYPSNIQKTVKLSNGDVISHCTGYYQRHFEGEHNLGHWQGPDAPGTEYGHFQARKMAGLLDQATRAGLVKKPVAHFVSPTVRTLDTAKPWQEMTSIREAQDELANPGSVLFRSQNIVQHNLREQISSHDGNPGASALHPLAYKKRQGMKVLNGSSAKDPMTDDLWKGQRNESQGHVIERAGSVFDDWGRYASLFTQHTGLPEFVFNGTGHADLGGQLFEKYLCTLAGIAPTIENCRFLNTQVNEFNFAVRTTPEGVWSFEPVDEAGHKVTFGIRIAPDVDEWRREFDRLNPYAGDVKRWAADGMTQELVPATEVC